MRLPLDLKRINLMSYTPFPCSSKAEMSCAVRRPAPQRGRDLPGHCRSSRYVEFGVIWSWVGKPLPHNTFGEVHYQDIRAGRSAGLAPSEGSDLLALCRGRSILTYGGAFGFEVYSQGAPCGLDRRRVAPANCHCIGRAFCKEVAAVGQATARASLALRALRSPDAAPTLALATHECALPPLQAALSPLPGIIGVEVVWPYGPD